MRSHGLDVNVISSPGELLDAFAAQEGVRSHDVDMTRRITPFADLVALAHLCMAMRRIRPHIVHAHSPKGGLLGMLAAFITRVPVRIYHIRGLPFMTARGLRRYVLATAERVSCRLAVEVLCVSESMRRVAVENRICKPHKLKVFLHGSGNGVDADNRFNPRAFDAAARAHIRAALGIADGALVVGFVGRVVRDKGICELAAAWRSIHAEFENAHLLVVGKLEDEDPVPPDVVAALRNDASVHLTGFQPADKLPELFSAMDVFVLPSYREGFPVVLLEAGAMELPVIATDIPGCTDAVVAADASDDAETVVDGETGMNGATGILVPTRDADALTRAIARYLRDGAMRAVHGAAARARVQRDYRQDDIWQAIKAEYERLLANYLR
jgi:glycosyltransferase involved in cell wall biosynthesis